MKNKPTTTNIQSLGDRLKFIRRKEKVTLEEASERSGISKSSIQRYESGETLAIQPEYLIFLNKLGYSLNWLYTGIELKKENISSKTSETLENSTRIDILEIQVNYLSNLILQHNEDSNWGKKYLKNKQDLGTN